MSALFVQLATEVSMGPTRRTPQMTQERQQDRSTISAGQDGVGEDWGSGGWGNSDSINMMREKIQPAEPPDEEPMGSDPTLHSEEPDWAKESDDSDEGSADEGGEGAADAGGTPLQGEGGASVDAGEAKTATEATTPAPAPPANRAEGASPPSFHNAPLCKPSAPKVPANEGLPGADDVMRAAGEPTSEERSTGAEEVLGSLMCNLDGLASDAQGQVDGALNEAANLFTQGPACCIPDPASVDLAANQALADMDAALSQAMGTLDVREQEVLSLTTLADGALNQMSGQLDLLMSMVGAAFDEAGQRADASATLVTAEANRATGDALGAAKKRATSNYAALADKFDLEDDQATAAGVWKARSPAVRSAIGVATRMYSAAIKGTIAATKAEIMAEKAQTMPTLSESHESVSASIAALNAELVPRVTGGFTDARAALQAEYDRALSEVQALKDDALLPEPQTEDPAAVQTMSQEATEDLDQGMAAQSALLDQATASGDVPESGALAQAAQQAIATQTDQRSQLDAAIAEFTAAARTVNEATEADCPDPSATISNVSSTFCAAAEAWPDQAAQAIHQGVKTDVALQIEQAKQLGREVNLAFAEANRDLFTKLGELNGKVQAGTKQLRFHAINMSRLALSSPVSAMAGGDLAMLSHSATEWKLHRYRQTLPNFGDLLRRATEFEASADQMGTEDERMNESLRQLHRPEDIEAVKMLIDQGQSYDEGMSFAAYVRSEQSGTQLLESLAHMTGDRALGAVFAMLNAQGEDNVGQRVEDVLRDLPADVLAEFSDPDKYAALQSRVDQFILDNPDADPDLDDLDGANTLDHILAKTRESMVDEEDDENNWDASTMDELLKGDKAAATAIRYRQAIVEDEEDLAMTLAKGDPKRYGTGKDQREAYSAAHGESLTSATGDLLDGAEEDLVHSRLEDDREGAWAARLKLAADEGGEEGTIQALKVVEELSKIKDPEARQAAKDKIDRTVMDRYWLDEDGQANFPYRQAPYDGEGMPEHDFVGGMLDDSLGTQTDVDGHTRRSPMAHAAVSSWDNMEVNRGATRYAAVEGGGTEDALLGYSTPGGLSKEQAQNDERSFNAARDTYEEDGLGMDAYIKDDKDGHLGAQYRVNARGMPETVDDTLMNATTFLEGGSSSSMTKAARATADAGNYHSELFPAAANAADATRVEAGGAESRRKENTDIARIAAEAAVTAATWGAAAAPLAAGRLGSAALRLGLGAEAAHLTGIGVQAGMGGEVDLGQEALSVPTRLAAAMTPLGLGPLAQRYPALAPMLLPQSRLGNAASSVATEAPANALGAGVMSEAADRDFWTEFRNSSMSSAAGGAALYKPRGAAPEPGIVNHPPVDLTPAAPQPAAATPVDMSRLTGHKLRQALVERDMPQRLAHEVAQHKKLNRGAIDLELMKATTDKRREAAKWLEKHPNAWKLGNR